MPGPGVHDDLAYYAFCAIKPRDLSTPAVMEAELVVQVQEQGGSRDIHLLSIQQATELTVIQIAVKYRRPPFRQRVLGAYRDAGILAAADVASAVNDSLTRLKNKVFLDGTKFAVPLTAIVEEHHSKTHFMVKDFHSKANDKEPILPPYFNSKGERAVGSH